jgi:hypothetical protein
MRSFKSKTMKTTLFFTLTYLFILSSCISVKQVGKLNMISNRNIDSQLNYELLASYSGGSKKELKKSRAMTVEDALDKTVKRIPGGEFLMNAKMYTVTKFNKVYFAMEGDVWGTKSNVAYRGFKVGDKVIIDGVLNTTATIKALKDDKTCFIERIGGIIEEIKYDRLTKAE